MPLYHLSIVILTLHFLIPFNNILKTEQAEVLTVHYMIYQYALKNILLHLHSHHRTDVTDDKVDGKKYMLHVGLILEENLDFFL